MAKGRHRGVALLVWNRFSRPSVIEPGAGGPRYSISPASRSSWSTRSSRSEQFSVSRQLTQW